MVLSNINWYSTIIFWPSGYLFRTLLSSTLQLAIPVVLSNINVPTGYPYCTLLSFTAPPAIRIQKILSTETLPNLRKFKWIWCVMLFLNKKYYQLKALISLLSSAADLNLPICISMFSYGMVQIIHFCAISLHIL